MENEKKIEIELGTKMRGFFKHLINIKSNKIMFKVGEEQQFFEINNRPNSIIRKVATGKLCDYFGVIQCIKNNQDNTDIIMSYNRFMKTKKPYFIVLENPTALYHYSLKRNKTYLGKKIISKHLSNKNLKGIVCISDACHSTINNLLGDIPNHVLIKTIYPLVPTNKYINEDSLKEKSFSSEFNCLYISSNFELKSGMEILRVFDILNNEGIRNIKLNIITNIDALDNSIINQISENPLISLEKFNLCYEELEKRYSRANLLIHASRQDSFALTILEGLKAGLPVLASNIYAIPEMIYDNQNGYLVEPKFLFFNYDNTPNEYVWNNRESTIYSKFIDNNIVEFIYNNIKKLDSNREELYRLSRNSLLMARDGIFSEENIINQWESFINQIL